LFFWSRIAGWQDYLISREIVFLEQDCRMARLFDFKRDCFFGTGLQGFLISREIVFLKQDCRMARLFGDYV
jgi:hypothetical protein